MTRTAVRVVAFSTGVLGVLTGLVAVQPARAAEGCRVAYTVTSQWSGGFVADVAVTNLGEAINGWSLGWSYGSGQAVGSAWNASVSQSGSAVTARNVGYNAALAGGVTGQFGLQGTFASANPVPTAFTLNGVACSGGATTTTTTTTTTGTTKTSTTSRATSSTSRTTTTTPRGTTTTSTTGGSRWEQVIGEDSFSSYAALENSWKYLYPWGPDHNGSARMVAGSSDHSQAYLDNGTLVLKATQVPQTEGRSTSEPYLTIKYHSAAVHARSQVLVNDQFPNWEVRGEFQAPSAKGTWPAMWLTGVNSWPPESDILEFKGDARNWFNTFRTAGDVDSTIVSVSSPSSTWHQYRAWLSKVNSTDVDIHYYVDGTWHAVHHAKGFVGKPMWLIINLQMEGSSGSPGPSAETFYRARKVYVGRTRTS
jgi:hypothetical protein